MDKNTQSQVFFLVGGNQTNQRAAALIKKWEQDGKNGIFLVTGYPNEKDGELISMIEYLIKHGVPKEVIMISGSYDTLSNVTSVEKMLNNRSQIVISTGNWHFRRFKLIFESYYPDLSQKVSFIPSNEKEIWYCIPIFFIYKIINPKIWQKICQKIRQELYELSMDNERIQSIAQKFGVNESK